MANIIIQINLSKLEKKCVFLVNFHFTFYELTKQVRQKKKQITKTITFLMGSVLTQSVTFIKSFEKKISLGFIVLKRSIGLNRLVIRACLSAKQIIAHFIKSNHKYQIFI